MDYSNEALRTTMRSCLPLATPEAGLAETGELLDWYEARIKELETWKASAMRVLSEWDAVFDALGKPGALGDSKAVASLARIKELEAALVEKEDHCLRVQAQLDAIQRAHIELLEKGHDVYWRCGCGTVNGVNLAVCRVCGRIEGQDQ